MSKSLSLALVMAILAAACWGCTSNVETPPAATSASAATHGKLCGSCGDEKGSDSCCSEDAEKCTECGLNKGSKLCCVELPADAKGKDLCASCGNVAGSAACCDKDAEVCDCGMAKGSPLCCKLEESE